MSINFIIKKILSYNVVGYLLLMATTIYLSRETSPEIVGLSVTLIALIEIIALINDFSVGQQFIQNYSKDDNPTSAFYSQLAIGVGFCFICLVVGFLFFLEYIWYLVFLMLFKLLSIVFAINSAKLYLENAFSFEAKVNIFLTALSCFISIVVLNFFNEKLWALIILYALPKVSSVVFAIYYPIKLDGKINIGICYLYILNGGVLLVSNGVQRLKVHVERILFLQAFGVVQLGYYTRARTFTDTLPSLFFGTSRNIVLTNLIKVEWNYSFYNKILRFDLLVVFFLMLFVNIFSSEIVTLILGSEWVGLTVYIQPLSLLVIINQVINYERVVLLSKKENSMLYKFSIFELVATILCFFIGGVVFQSIILLYVLAFLLSGAILFFSTYSGSNQKIVKIVAIVTSFFSLVFFLKYLFYGHGG